MFVGYCPHTKGYRVKLKDRVVVTPHVHFSESENGCAVIGMTAQEDVVQPQVEREREDPEPSHQEREREREIQG